MRSKSDAQLSRRLMLRGFGGAAITLPFLEFQNQARAQVAQEAKRFVVFFEHGGTISASAKDGSRHDGTDSNQTRDAWDPAVKQEALVLGPIMQPLKGLEDYLLLPRGIDNKACMDQSPYGGDHGWANVTALTAANASQVGPDGQTSHGPSIDFVLAGRLATRFPTKFPIVSLCMPAHNYGTPFFKGDNQPVDGDFNPTTVFNSLFANVQTTSQPDPVAVRARELKKSVLDGVHKGLDTYKNKMTTADKQTVDMHLTHIRALEQQVASVTIPTSPACTKPSIAAAGSSANSDYYSMDVNARNGTTGPVMVDIMIAAFRCGLTNVATLNIGDFYGKWLMPTYPAAYDIGHSIGHSVHDVGPKGVDAAHFQQWYDTMLINRQWRMGLLARFMQGLKATPEGTGNMLDNTVILETSEFSTGGDHAVADQPILLAGKGGGKLRTGRYVNFNTRAATNPDTLQYSTKASIHNLYTTLLNVFGYPDTTFGGPHVYVTGPLGGLTT